MRQAMIFAAGLGTRLKPLTDTMPKALVRVGGQPLLQRVIFRLRDAGVSRMVVNVHHFAGQIMDFLKENDNFGLDIRISDESDRLLETGGGIRKARHFFDRHEPVLIHNVDILSNADIDVLYRQAENADAVLLVSDRKTKRYLLFDDDMRLKGWTHVETGEVKSPYPDLHVADYRQLAFSGIHLIHPRLFPLMDTFGDKFGIIDFYLSVCGKCRIQGVTQDGLRLLDVGKQDTLAAAEEFLKK